jgi:hypothetical protein
LILVNLYVIVLEDSNQYFRNGERMKTFQRLTLTAILAASALLATGCSGNGAQAADPAPSNTASSTPSSPSSTASSTPTAVPSPATLPAGIVAKGVANDGKGAYLQTSIADTDPAMKYNPAITDDDAKANFSEADLAEAQKVAVKFIAEEAIDSTLNGGTDVDGWYAANKHRIHPINQSIMLQDLKAGKDAVSRESWMATKPGYSYVHGDNTPRVISRTITPTKISYVNEGSTQGVWVDTTASYSMKVTGGTGANIQSTSAVISYAVAKDPADGKWKIAAYEATYKTAPATSN